MNGEWNRKPDPSRKQHWEENRLVGLGFSATVRAYLNRSGSPNSLAGTCASSSAMEEVPDAISGIVCSFQYANMPICREQVLHTTRNTKQEGKKKEKKLSDTRVEPRGSRCFLTPLSRDHAIISERPERSTLSGRPPKASGIGRPVTLGGRVGPSEPSRRRVAADGPNRPSNRPNRDSHNYSVRQITRRGQVCQNHPQYRNKFCKREFGWLVQIPTT
jgi:hypothetical protein